MRLSRLRLAFLLARGAAALTLAPGGRSSRAPTTATFEGREIPLAEVGNHHCHDFDEGFIRCFATAAELEAAVEPLLGVIAGAESTGPAPETSDSQDSVELSSVAATSYVRIWSDASYGGSSVYLSANYADLRTIGWNDTISSFKSVNLGRGEFWTDINYSGYRYSFNGGDSVASLSSTYNDRFSSVRRT